MQGASQTVIMTRRYQFHKPIISQLAASTDIGQRQHHDIGYRLSADTRRQRQSHRMLRASRGEEQRPDAVDKGHTNAGHQT